MDDSKKMAIKNGENVSFDGGEVINSGIDLSREKSEEVKAPVVEDVAPVIPEVPVMESVTEQTVSEVPVIPTPTPADVSVPEVPAYDPTLSFSAPQDMPAPIELPTDITPSFPELPNVPGQGAMEQPQFGGFNTFESAGNDRGNISPIFGNTVSGDENGELFGSSYENVNLKVMPTVVTMEDEEAAKRANLDAYKRLYEAGPGSQISILRKFAEDAAKWIREVDKGGFVSGDMHDVARSILRSYEGLQPESDSFADDISTRMDPDSKAAQFNRVNNDPYSQDNGMNFAA